MQIDLIIPALDEEANIPPLMTALRPLGERQIKGGRVRRIIVVDNGSTDRTAALARQRGAVVVTEPERGYGSACFAGIAWIARGNDVPDSVAFLDADLADDPANLPTLWEPLALDTADFVIGSRHALAERSALDPHQKFGNRLSCLLLRILTGAKHTDLGPMRVIRWDALQSLNMRDRTWGWTVEMQYKAARRRLRTMEIDVPYRKRQAGKSKITGTFAGSVRAGVKILATIARLALTGR